VGGAAKWISARLLKSGHVWMDRNGQGWIKGTPGSGDKHKVMEAGRSIRYSGL
jgi:hypothetical protein